MDIFFSMINSISIDKRLPEPDPGIQWSLFFGPGSIFQYRPQQLNPWASTPKQNLCSIPIRRPAMHEPSPLLERRWHLQTPLRSTCSRSCDVFFTYQDITTHPISSIVYPGIMYVELIAKALSISHVLQGVPCVLFLPILVFD